MTCPSCGQQLQVVALDPATPPWLCQTCARGWWQVELGAAADYDPLRRDFGTATTDVRSRVSTELSAAVERGTSITVEMLPTVPDAVLAALVRLTTLSGKFAGQVKAEQARRKKPVAKAGA